MLYSANPLGQLTLSITRLHTDVVKILSIFPSKTLRLDQIFIIGGKSKVNLIYPEVLCVWIFSPTGKIIVAAPIQF